MATWERGWESNNKKVCFFRSCRGKHMFSGLVLTHHKAMYEKLDMADMAEKRGELIQVFLMR